MARNKIKYRGPRKLLAAMSIAREKKIKKITKYIYSVWYLLDGKIVKRRRLNPDYVAA